MKTDIQLVSLYKGKVIIEYRDGKHTYRNKKTGERLISVTAALGMINKPMLNNWRVKVFRDTLIDMRKTGISIKIDHIIEASKVSTAIKQTAADKGKEVHDWCERYIKFLISGKADGVPDRPEDEQVLNGVLAFKKWEQDHKVTWIAAEQIVYSRKYNYVGKIDAIAIVDKKLCAIDFKTGNAVYHEMRYQVAAYQEADAEESGRVHNGKKWLLRFDKDTADFEADQYGEHEEDFQAFLAALTLKRRDMKLTGRESTAKKPVELPY